MACIYIINGKQFREIDQSAIDELIKANLLEPNTAKTIAMAYQIAKEDETNTEFTDTIDAILNNSPKQSEQIKESPQTEQKTQTPKENQTTTAPSSSVSGEVSAPNVVEQLEKPIVIFKGNKGKLNIDGTKRTAHPDVEGVFGSTNLKNARRYGEDISEFNIPKGTTIETVELKDKNIPISEARAQETELINSSKAQIVKLITFDANGIEVQYIIKDKNLLSDEQIAYKKEVVELSEKAEKEYEKLSKRYFELDKKENRTFEEQNEIDNIETRMAELSAFLEKNLPTTKKPISETAETVANKETTTDESPVFDDKNGTNAPVTETRPTTEEKVAKVEKTIDEVADLFKKKLGFLIVPSDPNIKTSGITLDQLIDVVAQAAKQFAKGAIVTADHIQQAIEFLKDNDILGDFDENEIKDKATKSINGGTKTDKKEEVRLANKEADKKGDGVSEWLSGFRENIVSPQELTDLLNEMKISKTTITNAETIKQAQEILDSYQEEYDKGTNYKDPITRVLEDIKKGDLGTAVGQVMTQMLFKNTAKEISTALKEGNEQKAKYFFDLQAKIVEAYSEQGTDAGRALQVRKMFMDYVMSDPELADFYYMKEIQQQNEKNKKNKTLVESAEEIIDKVDTAKEKAKEKVAAKITTDLDTQIDSEISKAGGIGKNATEAKKKQVKDYVAKLREKLKTFNASTPTIIPISQKQVEKMLDGVEAELLEGKDLQSAIAKVSADMIRNGEATPKETTAMKLKINGARQQLKTPKEKTPEQREREKANAELKAAKEEYNAKQAEANDLEKRIEAQAKKVAALKAKEEQAQRDRIDATELQRIQMAAKEVQKEIEATKKQEIAEKRDLSARLLRQEEKLAALKAKEQEAIDNANAKRDLDAALLEQKTLEANKKELQKSIDKLTKEVINAAKKSDQNVIENIIEAFYSKEDQLQSDLEKMVVEALGVTEKEAVKIAESIKNQMETELRSKLIKELENATKLEEEKSKKETTTEYVKNFLKGLSSGKKKQNTIVDKLLQLSMMGVLKTDDIMDLMKNKYGQQEFTFEMSNYIKEQAKKINEADTQGRKNKEMAKLTDKMAELAPLYYNEAMNSLWYGAVLSGFGTQDANITFNITQVVNSFYRSLALTVVNNLKNEGTITDKTKSIGKDLYAMFFRTLYQAANEGKFKPINIISSTTTDLIYGLQEGVSSFAETQKALESQQQSEMDYSRYAKWMKVLNNFKYVGRALSAMDLATQNLIKNSWIVPILREVYGQQGLSPKAIDAKIQQELISNTNEIEAVTNEAIADIVKYDISVKKVGDKYHVMYENKTVFISDTEQEAINLKEEAAKKQTIAVKRFAYERLQNRINEQALKSATHLSQETIMSAAPSGLRTSGIYDFIINLKNNMTQFAKEQEKEARASNKLSTKIGKGQAARITYAAARIVPFVKMAINLAENFFIKDNPLGYLRAMQIEKAVKNPKNKAEERLADFYQSQSQINDLKARAIIGTLAWAVPLLLKSLINRDDEDKEKKKEEEFKAQTKNEIAVLKELEESTGQPMEEGNPYLLTPKNGETFGSLDFMPFQTKKALESAGLAKEHSIYKGVYPNGKFVSIVSDPSKFNYVNTVTNTVAMINKYVVNNKFDKLSDEDKSNKIEQVILSATAYSLMSFGSFSITKHSKNLVDLARQGKTADAAAQVAEGLIPELALANPAFLKQNIRYVDGISREFVTPSKDFTTYLGTKVPILGSFISVYGADKRRGMFGEDMYSVPAMQQGGISNYYYDMRFGNKNKAEKEMYQFLASKGYNKLKAMPNTLSIKSIDGTKETVITDGEVNKLGAEAGQKVFKRLQTDKEFLSKLPNSIVNRYVDNLFNMEFKNAWLVSKGVYTEKNVKEKNEEFVKEVESSIDKLKAKIKKDKENNVSDEMKKFRSELPTDKYDRKIYLGRVLESKTNKQTTLQEWEEAGIIKKESEKEELLKLAK